MKPKLNINESFICKIWEGGSSYFTGLQTTTGEDVEVISFGKRNYDAGPDYKDAKIKLEGKTFTGDVEIHRDFKNWAEHKHSKDRKYNPVILHVVMWDSIDREDPKLRIKRALPTVILSNFLKESIHNVWQDVINKPSDKLRLPCYGRTGDVDSDIVTGWLDKLSAERLKLKVERLRERAGEIAKQDGYSFKNKALWEELLYEFTFEALGFSKNKEQMLSLASNLPLKLINKLMQKNGSPINLQTLLLGSAGFLFDVRLKDEYIDIIKEHWKNKLEPLTIILKMNRHEWNFFRMRPQNFPTIRLAYGSQLILNILYRGLFKEIITTFSETEPNKVHKKLIQLLKPSRDEYWETHYDLGKMSSAKNKLMGGQRTNDVITNVLIPLTAYYAEEFNDKKLLLNVMNFYHSMKLKPDNSVVKVIEVQALKPHKLKLSSPAMEQAAIQLYNFYCMRERCGNCAIGKRLDVNEGYEYKIIFY